MKTIVSFVILVLFCSMRDARGGERVLRVDLKPAGPQIELSWPAEITAPVAGTTWGEFQVQKSRDLQSWDNVQLVTPTETEGRRRVVLAAEPQPVFYRVLAQVQNTGGDPDGAQVFGYSTALKAELDRLGQLSLEDFQAAYAPRHEDYLPGLTWDPRRALYWDEFNTDPAVYNAQQPSGSTERRLTDFRLNAQELELFLKNGFVVSERLGSYSFADVFYRIFIDDLPVFVSTDAILQAWHRSYLTMLQEMEELVFCTYLEQMLQGMSEQIPVLWQAYGQTPLKDSISDADYYLTVAQSLLSGTILSPRLGVTTNVPETLQAIDSLEYTESFAMFGVKDRPVDFSQFKVRGHYERSERLQRYFRAMIWCGRIDLRIAGANAPLSERQLATAVLLYEAMKRAGQYDKWRLFDQALQQYVGWTDSMTCLDMKGLLEASGATLDSLVQAGALKRLQDQLLTGQIGVQQIRSDLFYSPLGLEQIQLPRSFTLLGQKFVLDSWALSELVFDRILWNDQKVQRRIPSCLDVAFSVLGNNDTVPDLVDRMASSTGMPFRDGLPYQHNLVALRHVIDRQSQESWGQNIYLNWLAALRALSRPTTSAQYPEVMRTRAWSMKNLNTQLASWTHLRHDTILYAKQSYTGGILCSYPYGFVEPRIGFWSAMAQMARRSAILLSALPFQGSVDLPETMQLGVPVSQILTNQAVFLQKFASTLEVLRSISQKELAQQPLLPEETNYLKNLMERQDNYYGTKQYSGWYPALFYRPIYQVNPYAAGEGSDTFDALIADVHTDVPAPAVGDPGGVLHQAVGNANLLMIAIDNGPDKMIYAGPVLSHYEIFYQGIKRVTDSEWQAAVQGHKQPSPPSWTRAYLAPATP